MHHRINDVADVRLHMDVIGPGVLLQRHNVMKVPRVLWKDILFQDGQEADQVRYRLLDRTPVTRIDESSFHVDGRTLTVAP